jgi:uncharacterized protein
MALLTDDFRPAWGLWSGHAQSLFGVVARPRMTLPLRRERSETPDGDFIDLDHLDGEASAPTLLVLHGLEGSSAAGYVQLTLREAQRRGWNAVALNARGCSGEPNRLAAAYSSGDARDLAWVVGQTSGPLFAVGFSLGASVLLNFLAKDAGASRIAAAVAVSTPFQLELAAKFLDSRTVLASRYRERFLPAMKAKALAKARHHPQHFDVHAIARTSRIRDFDHHVTARHFGFSSAEDYYAQCSTGPRLKDISTPTLLISSRDDALAPPALPADVTDNPCLDVLLTRYGGHVGFASGSLLRPNFWVEPRAVEWLAATPRRPMSK